MRKRAEDDGKQRKNKRTGYELYFLLRPFIPEVLVHFLCRRQTFLCEVCEVFPQSSV
jgi:hypothetical protein